MPALASTAASWRQPKRARAELVAHRADAEPGRDGEAERRGDERTLGCGHRRVRPQLRRHVHRREPARRRGTRRAPTHARRGPLATTSAKNAAAYRPQVAYPAPDGPVWNRSTSVSGQSGKRNAKPNAAGIGAEVGDSGRPRAGAARPPRPRPATATSTPRNEATTSRPERMDPTRNGDDEQRDEQRGGREERHRDRGEHADAEAWRGRGAPGSVIAAEPGRAHERRHEERHDREEHQGAESTVRDRVRAAVTGDTADVYLRLHLLSTCTVAPHGLDLGGVFGLLANVAWTNLGPVAADAVDDVRWNARRQRHRRPRPRPRQVSPAHRLRHAAGCAHRRRQPRAPRRAPRARHHRHARGLRQLQRRHARDLDGRGTHLRRRGRRRRHRHRRRGEHHGHAVGRRQGGRVDRRALPARRRERPRHLPRRRLRRSRPACTSRPARS